MREKERKRERERERGFDRQNVYTTDTRRESTEHVCGIWILFVRWNKTEKEEFPFHQKRSNFGTTFFLFFFSRMNVLKFAKINVGGWKQDTHDAYIKDLKPIKRSDDICYRYYCCCCLLKHEAWARNWWSKVELARGERRWCFLFSLDEVTRLSSIH